MVTSVVPSSVSIIVPAFNKWQYTFKCLMKLLENTQGVPHETIVVDNASSDETPLAMPQLQGIRYHRNETNLGFAKACNQGAQLARGQYLLFLNNDTEPQPGWLPPMVRCLDTDPAVQIVGSKLLFPDGFLQHAGVAVSYAAPFPISPFHIQYRHPAHESTRVLELNVVTGACLLIRAETFRKLGGFHEGYVNGYEDVDLCLQVREAGGLVVYTPESVLIHHESISEGRFAHTSQNLVLLHRRWLGRFKAFDYDPRLKRVPLEPVEGRPATSFVIVAKDDLDSIAGCVESVLNNACPRDEVVIVDDGSQDCTERFLEQIAAEHPAQLKVRFHRQPLGARASLQEGIGLATRKWVALVDSRVSNGKGWLDNLYLASRELPEGALAAGPMATGGGKAPVLSGLFGQKGTFSALAANAADGVRELVDGIAAAKPVAPKGKRSRKAERAQRNAKR